MQRGWVALMVGLSLALAACAHASPSCIVLGRVTGISRQALWERSLAALTHAGYEPELQDPVRGVIVVPSHYLGSRARFIVQLYREGWVQVAHEGFGLGYARISIRSALAEEHEALSFALSEGILHPERSSATEVAPPEDP
ncbi:MAG: hypothetical protein KC619_25935 [Myxococcales bacterium]|nr:hypothetical protein [Myxococcales bacterium]